MPRILFVDDEPKILQGLRRMLSSCRKDWSMHFCEGPLPALEALRECPFDVVVTDMRMPVMDGAELLEHVRELSPNAVRIILSGQAEQERLLRAIGPAHQFLSKPCDPDILRSTIVRAVHLSERLSNPDLRNFVSCLETLPSLPEIYLALVAEIHKEEGSVEAIGRLIEQDLAMTATVLRLVNSSLFGLQTHVVDARHAAALLGLEALKPLVLAAGIFRLSDQDKLPTKFLSSVFEHSFAVAGAARLLAKEAELNKELVEKSFTIGILHDIGKLVMAENLGDKYLDLCQLASRENVSPHVIEMDRFGTTHAEVGGYLLSLWGMDQQLIEAVTLHHDPSQSHDEEFSPLTAVHLANTICVCQADQAHCRVSLDRKYLNRIHVDTNLEHWREIAEQSLAVV